MSALVAHCMDPSRRFSLPTKGFLDTVKFPTDWALEIPDVAGVILSNFADYALKQILRERRKQVKQCRKLQRAECCRICDPRQCRPCLLEFPAELQERCGLEPPVHSVHGPFHLPVHSPPGDSSCPVNLPLPRGKVQQHS